jgi:hypothetical protein
MRWSGRTSTAFWGTASLWFSFRAISGQWNPGWVVEGRQMELLLGGATTLPGLDPNWFYSSIAQSAAAIVGLLGAIFATHLQDQITTAREQRLATTQSLKDLHDRLIGVRKPLAEYLEHTEVQLQFLRQHLSSGGQVERAPWYSPLEMASRNGGGVRPDAPRPGGPNQRRKATTSAGRESPCRQLCG